MINMRQVLKMIPVLIMVLSACTNKPPEPTSSPTHPLAANSPVSQVPSQNPPISTPEPEPLSARLGHVWVPGVNDFAAYAYRSFLQIPVGMTRGPDGKIYIADWAGHHIVRFATDGTLDELSFWNQVMALQYDGPRGIAFDSKGNLYTSNHGHVIRIDTNGTITELQGFQAGPLGSIAISPTDELYYTDRSPNGALRKWNPSGNSEPVVANLPFAENMAFGLDGTLYLTQMAQGQILKVDIASGIVSTFKEDACGNDPCYLAVDAEGDIWARGINRLSQFTPEGIEKTFLVDGIKYPGGPYGWHTAAGIAFDGEGGLWIASYNSRLIRLVPVTPGQPDPEFSLQVVFPGFEATDLDVDPAGAIYAPDMNTNQIFQINADGERVVLAKDLPGGRTAIAVDKAGTVFLGLPSGEIVYLGADGSRVHYAKLVTRRMVFGMDGTLYAIAGDYNQSKSIVRISGVDTYTTLAKQIDGIPLGSGDAHISPALNKGFYVFTEGERNLFFVDYDGQGHLIANLAALGGGGPAVMAASPVTGVIYFVPHGPYTVFKISAEGTSEEIASRVFGDPWGMVVSKDGNWLYIAESGAVDKIPISNIP
jgi:sugar lactone lactonase YvrE